MTIVRTVLTYGSFVAMVTLAVLGWLQQCSTKPTTQFVERIKRVPVPGDTLEIHDTIHVPRIVRLPARMPAADTGTAHFVDTMHLLDLVRFRDSVNAELKAADVQISLKLDTTLLPWGDRLIVTCDELAPGIHVRYERKERELQLLDTIAVPLYRSKWSLGLHGGYGYLPIANAHGPVVSIGVNFTLFEP